MEKAGEIDQAAMEIVYEVTPLRLSGFRQTLQIKARIEQTKDRNPAKDNSLMMAETFIKAGLGSINLWKKSEGDVQGFLNASLSAWVDENGGVELKKHAHFSLCITTTFLGANEKWAICALID